MVAYTLQLTKDVSTLDTELGAQLCQAIKMHFFSPLRVQDTLMLTPVHKKASYPDNAGTAEAAGTAGTAGTADTAAAAVTALQQDMADMQPESPLATVKKPTEALRQYWTHCSRSMGTNATHVSGIWRSFPIHSF